VVAPVSGGAADTASLGRRPFSPGRASRSASVTNTGGGAPWSGTALTCEPAGIVVRAPGDAAAGDAVSVAAWPASAVPEPRFWRGTPKIAVELAVASWLGSGGAEGGAGGGVVVPPAPPRLARATASTPAARPVTW
jgi:hypothetical protein